MELRGKVLCMTAQELAEIGILTMEAVKKLYQRGQVRRVQRGCRFTPALYDVESLPYRYKVEVYRRYPDMVEKETSKPFVERVQPDPEAIAFYAGYQLEDGRHLPLDKQHLYANGVAILQTFEQLIVDANEERASQSAVRLPLGDFWRRAAAALPRIASVWKHCLPTNPRSLQRKASALRKKGYEALITGKYLNKSAAKIATAAQQAMITFLCAHHNNLDNAMIARLYNAHAQIQEPNWPSITAGAVGNWKRNHPLEVAAGQLGGAKFAAKREMQVKRRKPSTPFLIWSLDGWVAELLYQATTCNKRGNTTSYHHRMTVVVVLDPSCDYPMGYAIGEHESPALIKEALRDAAKHSQELTGEMLRVAQLQSDHYALKTLTPLYEIAGEKFTPAKVKNAKAKPVERYFLHLNKKCQLFNNWSGFGVTTDPDKQPNPEALNALRKGFPDAAGVTQQIRMLLEQERADKREKFLQLLGKLPLEKRIPMSKQQYLLAYGAETGHTNRLCGAGLQPTILGERRSYDCFDVRFRDHASEQWRVLYDPEDLGEVLAVNEDGSRQYMLESKYVQPMALADRQEGDAAQLERVFAFNKDLRAVTTQRIVSAQEKVEQLITGDGQIKGLLGRVLITDSKGQHKNQRSAELAAFEEVEEASPVKEETPEAPPVAAKKRWEPDYSMF